MVDELDNDELDDEVEVEVDVDVDVDDFNRSATLNSPVAFIIMVNIVRANVLAYLFACLSSCLSVGLSI